MADFDLEPNIPAKPKAKADAAVVSAPNAEDRVKIILERNADIPPTGLPVSLNGRACIIVPGQVVEVTRGILNVLDEAITSAPIVDPATGQPVGYEDRLRFPYRLV